MHTKAKSRLTVVLILISFLVISMCSITAIFALTQQNTKTRVDIQYIAYLVPLESMTFTPSSDGTSYSVTDCDNSAKEILIIPETYNDLPVTSIGSNAFSSCTGLTSIEIPDSVTGIGVWAFSSCTGLTSVTIGSGVTSIRSSAFSGCAGLTSITVASGNTKYHSVGNCLIETATKTLVRGCKTSEIPIDDSVTGIGEKAFSNCIGLTSIEIPDSVTSVGSNAFFGCTGLTSVEIPSSVTSIGDWVFSYCIGLTSVTIGSGVISIGENAFFNCIGLTSIEIPDSVTSIRSSAFSNCTGLTSITVASGNTKYHSVGNCLIETATKTLVLGCKTSEIPIDDSVTGIGVWAFSNCIGLTSIEIPDSVISIGISAFAGCTGLTSVTFKNTEGWFVATSLTATSGTDLSSTDLANTSTAATYLTSTYSSQYWKLKVVDTSSFSYTLSDDGNGYVLTGSTADKASLVGRLIIPETYNDGTNGQKPVVKINATAFEDCNNITEVIIPNSVTRIDAAAFRYCSNLKRVYIPESVTFIGLAAFYTLSNSLEAVYFEKAEYWYITGLNEFQITGSVNSELISDPEDAAQELDDIISGDWVRLDEEYTG